MFGFVWLSGLAFQKGAMADDVLQVNECSFDKATPTKITHIDDYGVVSLENGPRVKLADLFFPLNKDTGTLSPQTILQIKQMLKGQGTRALISGPADRYGRAPAFLYVKNPTGEPYLVQQALIRSNAAVYMPEPQLKKTFVSNCEFDQIRAELIAIPPKELTFRKIKRVGFAPIFSAKSQNLWGLEGEFVIVQGVVTEVRRTKRGISINFGDDWKNDFTAYLSPLVSKSFDSRKIMNSNLTGQQVQLRGFLDLYYGPSMRIDHLTQLEMLSE
ncbi:MAG: hypothetical protein ABJK39_07715 [Hyphomicrobiales bacterium]